jgi:DNA-binding response OmpR family regulator
MHKIKVYYIEDELSLGRIVSDTLEKQGYEVKWESNGARVISGLENYNPEICVLDIMLPNVDGYTICRTLRSRFPLLPVIFLTAKTDTPSLVKGFESGGTDYIKKPFSMEELIIRIENQLKLVKTRPDNPDASDILKIGSYSFDPLRYELKSDSGYIKLSNRDMQLLKMLYANRNRITARKDLLMAIWGDDSYFNSRNLDVYIRKLRHHFSTDKSIEIITLKGNGYLFIVP